MPLPRHISLWCCLYWTEPKNTWASLINDLNICEMNPLPLLITFNTNGLMYCKHDILVQNVFHCFFWSGIQFLMNFIRSEIIHAVKSQLLFSNVTKSNLYLCICNELILRPVSLKWKLEEMPYLPRCIIAYCFVVCLVIGKTFVIGESLLLYYQNNNAFKFYHSHCCYLIISCLYFHFLSDKFEIVF